MRNRGVRCWGVIALSMLTVCCTVGRPPEGLQAAKTGRVTALAAGRSHTCALLEGGRVRCWGEGRHGQLGYGNTASVGDSGPPSSRDDVDVGERVVQLTAGDVHTCALLEGGRVRCWGDSDYGQLGYGTRNRVGDTSSPAAAGDVDVGGRVVQLAAGGMHTCALLEGGRVRCWGAGFNGELGYGGTKNVGDTARPATAGEVDVGGKTLRLAVGGDHACALLEGGRVRCWGNGGSGQLGYGNTRNVGETGPPAAAGDVDLGGKAIELTAGDDHTCALLEGGRVRCWGQGRFGQLGYGNARNVGDAGPPAAAGEVDVGGRVLQLTAGRLHTCALLQGGRVRCWGGGLNGQLGYGSTSNVGDTSSPAAAGDVKVGGTVIQLAAGAAHTCAVLEGGHVRCWGQGGDGRLGYGNQNNVGDTGAPAAAGDVPIGR